MALSIDPSSLFAFLELVSSSEVLTCDWLISDRCPGATALLTFLNDVSQDSGIPCFVRHCPRQFDGLFAGLHNLRRSRGAREN